MYPRPNLRPLWLTLAALTLCCFTLEPFQLRVQAAAAFVRETTCSGDDATCTWATAPSADNIILIFTTTETEAQTTSITGWTPSITTLNGPTDSAAFVYRGYIFCTIGDGADTTTVVTTSSTNGAQNAMVEVSGIGTDCNGALDDIEAADCTGDAGTPEAQSLTTDLTTTVAGDFIFGMGSATNIANWTPTGGYTSVPAGDGEIANQAQGAWKVAGASGTEDVTWTTAAVEDTFCQAVAMKAAGGAAAAPRLTLLGVG